MNDKVWVVLLVDSDEPHNRVLTEVYADTEREAKSQAANRHGFDLTDPWVQATAKGPFRLYYVG